jgi:hypothetical protein
LPIWATTGATIDIGFGGGDSLLRWLEINKVQIHGAIVFGSQVVQMIAFDLIDGKHAVVF